MYVTMYFVVGSQGVAELLAPGPAHVVSAETLVNCPRNYTALASSEAWYRMSKTSKTPPPNFLFNGYRE